MSKSVCMMMFCALLGLCTPAVASQQDRVATRARVDADLTKDLAVPWEPLPRLEGRTCLDGRPVADINGDIVEYWANIECPYCTLAEVVRAQRDHPDMCIVVRHSPGTGVSESVKKALSYEALREYSVNAANQFWLDVMPKTSLGIPAPYGSALQTALEAAAIDMKQFGETVGSSARTRVNADMLAARDTIVSTPTFVFEGLRFPACDFKADEIPLALEQAKLARKGDKAAREKITESIVNGLLGETRL